VYYKAPIWFSYHLGGGYGGEGITFTVHLERGHGFKSSFQEQQIFCTEVMSIDLGFGQR
jgi:hypothetical protein